MINKRQLLLILSAVIVSLGAVAQGRLNMRINEVMVQQDSAAGKPTGWVELYNSSYGSNAIEKMFITTMKPDEIFNEATYAAVKAAGIANEKDRDVVLRYLAEARPGECYVIPRGDERNTKISPLNHVVFMADGDSTAGTFHLPFTFTAGQENYVALYDVNGDLVDEVTVPATLPVGNSYAVKAEGRLPIKGAHPDAWEVRDGKTRATAITMGNYNTRETNENIEKFKVNDPYGLIITVIAMLIVFSALVLLYLCFKLFGKFAKGKGTEEAAAAAAPAASQLAADTTASTGGDDDEIAAICMALFQHFNAHDTESGVITFTDRDNVTAWNNKAGMMRPLPRKR